MKTKVITWLVYLVELLIAYLAALWGRGLLERILKSLYASATVATAARILFFPLVLAAFLLLHLRLNKYLKKRGSGKIAGRITVKRMVRRLTEAELDQYPIKGLLEGWHFSVNEISYGHYRVTGVDEWGRTVSRDGDDPDVLLLECENDVREIMSGG